MVSTCANPDCGAPFRQLKNGRLFLVDPRDRAQIDPAWSSARLEYYWLCGDCAPRFTLAVKPGNQVACVLRPNHPINDAQCA